MKAVYIITIKRNIGNLVKGECVEITSSAKPTPTQIADAFREKYGEDKVDGTIASYVLDIKKLE